MIDNEGDSKMKNSDDFDLATELSILATKNIIPSRVAKRLEQKLKEKNAKINKEQLERLVEIIRNIMRSYAKTKQMTEKGVAKKTKQPAEITTGENMQNLIDAIGKLQERITNIEKGTESKNRIVTTDDIKVPKIIRGTDPKWELDQLTELPNDPESVIVLMKWLQSLIDRCGHPNLSNILDYYVDIGWISHDTKISLIDYSQGITEEKKDGQNVMRDVTDLPSKDHIQSLIFIQKLKGRQFDKHFIDRIDDEISRIIKKVDNYQLK